jgi:hypothetical protein
VIKSKQTPILENKQREFMLWVLLQTSTTSIH